jgi:hypothetical protein
MKRLHKAAVLVLILSLAAQADVVYLSNGKKVEGTVVHLAEDGLRIQTSVGVQAYTREQVARFVLQRKGRDGKVRTLSGMFRIKLPFELATEHYVIKTDIGDHVPKSVGGAMEQLYIEYSRIFKVTPEHERGKTEVILFDKKDDFLAYANRIGAKPQKDSLGFFRASTRGPDLIVTYKRREGEFHTLSILYHEATHQFVRMVVPHREIPLWLNEGLAVYFENSEYRGGKLRTGIIPRSRLALLQRHLQKGKYVPLRDLMKRGRDSFDGVCYAESWSLVYFFVHARGGRYSKHFSLFFRAVRDGDDVEKAFEKHLTPKYDALERAWKKFVLNLKLPKK